jgi:GNAT superfamily N-acetyltransferase
MPVLSRVEGPASLNRIPAIEKKATSKTVVEYTIRLAPYNIARVKVERLARDRAYVHWVFVPPAFRGLGLGQVLLRRVLADADREGLTVALVAKSCGTMAQSPLERWYAENGFVARGPAEDGGTKMVRAPRIRASSRRHRRVA